MRSTLVFKNIREKRNDTWEDTCHILSNFITTKLDLSYTKEFIDSMISRANRGVGKEEWNNDHQQQQGNKSIFVQFINWRVAEEINSIKCTENNKSRGKSDVFEGVNNQKK